MLVTWPGSTTLDQLLVCNTVTLRLNMEKFGTGTIFVVVGGGSFGSDTIHVIAASWAWIQPKTFVADTLVWKYPGLFFESLLVQMITCLYLIPWLWLWMKLCAKQLTFFREAALRSNSGCLWMHEGSKLSSFLYLCAPPSAFFFNLIFSTLTHGQ